MYGWSPSLLLTLVVCTPNGCKSTLNFENVHNFKNLYIKILNLKKGLFCLLTKRRIVIHSVLKRMTILHFVNKQKRPFYDLEPLVHLENSYFVLSTLL